MDETLLVKIESLHARVVKESGLALKRGGQDFVTGTVSAVLDDAAGPTSNLGVVNLTAGTIQLRWSIVATLPLLADALAAGIVAPRESGAVRVTFEEAGPLLPDGSGFDATGTGSVAPGSMLSGATIYPHTNYVRVAPTQRGRPPHLAKTLAKGQPVRCALLPQSYVEAGLPKALGGGKHSLNLIGGFTLVPIVMPALEKATAPRGKR